MSSLSSSKIPLKSSISSHSSCYLSKSKFIWRFSPSKFDNLPSCNSKQLLLYNIQPLNIDNELLQRQELSILIYHLGLQLNVSFTCIYTGIVYMHRFFMLHPFQQCFKESVGAACLFLACKVNEMPRPLNEFTRYLYEYIHNNSEDSSLISRNNITSNMILNSNQQIIDYENILLSTLGFCLHIEQPYMIITRISQILSIPLEITEKANEIATKSIFLTLFSMKYTTNLIGCFSLYLALISSEINISDNEDGSQWFHLINEEFTEKLLKELVDKYQMICINKCSKKIQQRFEQIRQQKKNSSQQIKSNTNVEQFNSRTYINDSDQHNYPIATTSGSVRSTTSSTSSSSNQQQININEHGLIETDHHTPNRSSLINISHHDYSPSMETFVQSSLLSKQNQTNFSGQHHPNNSSIISTKPIPTLMTSSNSIRSRYHSRYSAPMFKYPSTSPTERIIRPPPPPPLHSQQYHHEYSSNYIVTSSYYPQQQAPLFYHSQQDPSNIDNKRYGEPPAPPMKRFRYDINTYQHY